MTTEDIEQDINMDSMCVEDINKHIEFYNITLSNVEKQLRNNMSEIDKLRKENNTLKKENRKIKNQAIFNEKLLKTRPYRFAGFLRKIAMKIRNL
ncbi:MAG: hypothetical protein ACOX01_04865 [Methanobrevibacter boviskoreani]|jgi:predicted  nucleic acid-binding Zn-ribbon protein|uniref:hypothetical protein n=1 Tax=Methanobrevibacter boviskoreani TaxID=1348249 RepID=UPI0023A7EEF1|nr:hypothetical protein [Methanobrevibacter boviskoreani]MCI6774767.1 hypothetical protein [Methanobrevibacter boviskoreani]MCI6929723.1 hypothetical protein [Methanobrevibacter boviskoreani]